MEKREELRKQLPQEAAAAFDDIVTGRVLGASRHIRMIGEMMLTVAGGNLADEEKVRLCLEIGGYFKNTRGKSSYAVVSAINLMTSGFSAGGKDAASCIPASVQRYFEDSTAHTDAVLRYACALAEPMSAIMVYDYSSTVEKFVTALNHRVTVYVPESRAIDGGRPFVAPFVAAGHDVRFLPDAAMLTVLPQVQAVFIGAETYYPDGTAFNTVGSEILAELCLLRRVPYYVLTPLVKLDMRATEGIFKPEIGADLAGRLAACWDEDLRTKTSFYSIELVEIAPRLITAYITERGIIPPAALFQIAREYNDEVNGRRREA